MSAGHAGWEAWPTKLFHEKNVWDPLKAEMRSIFVYDQLNTAPYKEGEKESNLLQLSRSLPDLRGGLGGAGARADHVEALRSVTLSSKREGTREKF